MSVVTRLKDLFARLRPVDPYHYECTVCERVYPAERSTCSVCGGAVERLHRREAASVDPSP